jgi:hypothetical protein
MGTLDEKTRASVPLATSIEINALMLRTVCFIGKYTVRNDVHTSRGKLALFMVESRHVRISSYIKYLSLGIVCQCPMHVSTGGWPGWAGCVYTCTWRQNVTPAVRALLPWPDSRSSLVVSSSGVNLGGGPGRPPLPQPARPGAFLASGFGCKQLADRVRHEMRSW